MSVDYETLDQTNSVNVGQSDEADISLISSGMLSRCGSGFPMRYLMAVLAFLGFVNIYGMRVNFSITLVEMVTRSNVSTENGTWNFHQAFDWDREQQGILLSAFFWGYIVTQFPGGLLACKFGGHKVYGFGILLTAVLTVLTPVAAKYGSFRWIMVLRILEGLAEGVTYPAHAAFWSKWAPNLERTKLVGMSAAGSYAGTLITLPLCGLLVDYFDWESVFYIFGASGLCWTILWFFLASETPESNRFIAEEEKRYVIFHRDDERKAVVIKEVPWKLILTSMPVYAALVTNVCGSWGWYTLLTELPTYMKDVLKFDIKENGFLSGLPYLAMTVAMFAFSSVADVIRKRRILSTTSVRKIFAVIGYLGQAIFLLLTGFTRNSSIAVAYLTLAVGFSGIASSSLAIIMLDIAPRYSGIIMGISNCIATVPGIVSPILTGVITREKTLNEWRIVFFISSSVYTFGAVFFGLFASGEVQPWNRISSVSS